MKTKFIVVLAMMVFVVGWMGYSVWKIDPTTGALTTSSDNMDVKIGGTLSIGATGTISEETNTMTLDDGDGAPITLQDIRSASGGFTDLTSFDSQTAWRVFYSNADGDTTELALGADGEYLKSNGAAAAPTWAAPSGAAHDAVTLGASLGTNLLGLSTQELTLDAQTAAYFFAGPASGDPAAPAFRAIADADIPASIARDTELPAGDDMGAVDTLAELNTAISDATLLDDGAIAASTAIGLSTGATYTNYGVAGDDSLNEMFAAVDTALGVKKYTQVFDPKTVCDGAVDRLFLFSIGAESPNGIIIDSWSVSFEADPDTEADLDLKYADAWIGVANSAVMDVLDTTTGASSESTAGNINGGAAVATSKVVYLEFGTAYTEANHQVIFEMRYHNAPPS